MLSPSQQKGANDRYDGIELATVKRPARRLSPSRLGLLTVLPASRGELGIKTSAARASPLHVAASDHGVNCRWHTRPFRALNSSQNCSTPRPGAVMISSSINHSRKSSTDSTTARMLFQLVWWPNHTSCRGSPSRPRLPNQRPNQLRERRAGGSNPGAPRGPSNGSVTTVTDRDV